MDFSIVLLAPFSAIVAIATLVVAALSRRSRPRLLWPFCISSLLAAPIFVGPPVEPLIEWVFALLIILIWTALGTLIGGISARFAIHVVRRLRF